MTYRNSTSPRGLYRNQQDALLFGVCAGLARRLQVPAWGIRVVAVVLTPMTGFFPMLIAYIVLAVIMKPEPESPPGMMAGGIGARQGFSQMPRSMALGQLEERFAALDKRLQQLETIVTSPTFDLDQEYRRL